MGHVFDVARFNGRVSAPRTNSEVRAVPDGATLHDRAVVESDAGAIGAACDGEEGANESKCDSANRRTLQTKGRSHDAGLLSRKLATVVCANCVSHVEVESVGIGSDAAS